jgi:putative membrane protein
MKDDKLVFRLVAGVSVFVFVVIAVLQSKVFTLFPDKSSIPGWVFSLPALNALLNGTCSILLLVSLYFIRRKNIAVHKTVNIITFLLSSLFLVSYIIFHSTGIKTTYGGEGGIRYFYYFILITHIILAAVVLPLVLLSFHHGLKMQVERHRKLVRWSYPIWLYVTVTGVIVYIMISPYYTF